MDAIAKIVFAGLLVFGAVLRIWLCFHDDGIFWPDEIYQSLEPAHHLVFGYGLVPWEFVEGARSWAFPGLVAGLLRTLTWVIGEHPRHYLVGVRLAFCAISMLTVWGTYQLARTCGARAVGASLAALCFALSPATIYFAPRAMSETASAVAVAFGLALTLQLQASRRQSVIGALLLGLSALIRLQNGLFCLSLIGILLARRQWRSCVWCTVVLLGAAVVYGALDRLTWGSWYHSVIEYLRFNVVQGKSAQWGTSEPTLYLRVLWTSMPLVMVWVAPLALLGGRRSMGLLLTAITYVVVHSLVGHKEYRFLIPVLPVLFALAGAGFCTLVVWRPFPARVAASVIAATLVLAACRFHGLTFGDFGQYGPTRARDSAFDDFGPVNRLLIVAHDRPDLCGIAVLAAHLSWTGGATYLHRNVPIYKPGAWTDVANFNYALTLGGAGGQVVAAEGPYSLVSLGRSSCLADPKFQWRL
jgi:GPI mannosyltransferase 3